ncbi:phosphoglycerate mutase family protein [Nonomuraea sp. NPDC049646]|uniref:phosphoglycerate mutase family protein n=1 Tax=unclassified Nonomuraea TaxID=2593643 RepID=UPI00379A3A3D
MIHSMRTRMFFVRHGDSRHKQEGVIGGPNGCRGLTDTGHWQAAQLGRRIAAEIGDDTTAIYSSPPAPRRADSRRSPRP